MTPGLALALCLTAFPLPPDAGVAEFADPANWPDEPGWLEQWPLLSFVPPGFEALSPLERDAGIGLQVDRAWTITRGAPTTLIAVIAPTDAGLANLGWINAPVDDGVEGVGTCPACTVLPLLADEASLAQTIAFAADAGARTAVLLDPPELPSAAVLEALTAVQDHTLVVTPGRGTPVSAAVELHAAVWVPRALTTDAARSTARDPRGCGARSAAARISVPSTSCQREAALRLAGVAGLVWTVAPALHPRQVAGLLSGPRADAWRAVTLAQGLVPAAPATVPTLRPSLVSPPSDAETCALVRGDGRSAVACAGEAIAHAPARRLDDEPLGSVIPFVEARGPLEWWTPLWVPPSDPARDLLGLDELGLGAGAPRFVDVDGLGSEAVLAARDGALMGFTDRVESIAALAAGRPLTPAFGDLLDDRRLDVVTLTRTGRLDAVQVGGARLAGFPLELGGPPAGPPMLAQGPRGTVLVTALTSGRLEQRRGATADWALDLPAPLGGPAALGDVDGDGTPDVVAIAGGQVHAVLLDNVGPRPESWARATAASSALLANLVGDEALELVVDQVLDARGEPRLQLEGWLAPAAPPALGRLTSGAARSLVQLEPTSDGAFVLARYDVEAALRRGDRFAPKQALATIRHPPARGGVAIGDVTGDGRAEVIVPTEDGLVFLVDGSGAQPAESPLPALGSVFDAPALGVARNRLELAWVTTRGDLVRWRARGFPEDLSWEGAGHDRGNTSNAETPLPRRVVTGLGITEPPELAASGCAGCGASPGGGVALLTALLFGLRRRRETC